MSRGTSFDSRLFLADNHESTIQSTMQYQGLTREEAPTQMITMGLADIMEAEHILNASSGVRKAQGGEGYAGRSHQRDCLCLHFGSTPM